jgi:hypothetical protein
MDVPEHTNRDLWPVPLLAGLLPFVGAVVAYRLSVRLGLVPDCNLFFDGCVSISRAARHDLPNILFRALLLPAAVLQAICWLLSPGWLRTLGAAPDRWQRALPALGVAAGVFLVLYGTFLGTEGAGYRWMRRYGVVFYFGLTCIAMLIVSDQMRRRLQGRRLESRGARRTVAARRAARVPHRRGARRTVRAAAANRACPRSAAAVVDRCRTERRAREQHRMVGWRDFHCVLLYAGLGLAQDGVRAAAAAPKSLMPLSPGRQ